MKNHLQVCINHMQDNWVDHMSIVEFVANNHINALTEISSFIADNGFHPCTSAELP